jgi:hypothetical protein
MSDARQIAVRIGQHAEVAAILLQRWQSGVWIDQNDVTRATPKVMRASYDDSTGVRLRRFQAGGKSLQRVSGVTDFGFVGLPGNVDVLSEPRGWGSFVSNSQTFQPRLSFGPEHVPQGKAEDNDAERGMFCALAPNSPRKCCGEPSESGSV